MWRIVRNRQSLTHSNSFGLYNPKIYHNKQEYNLDEVRKFVITIHITQHFKTFLIGLRNRRSGTIFLNKPNYNNVRLLCHICTPFDLKLLFTHQKLNIESLDQLYRFLRSYDVDGSLNHIWIQNIGTNCFSAGIQFEDLKNHPDYLHRLFTLSLMVSKINKPIMGYIKGFVGGCAAYLLKLFSSPFGTKHTYLRLDDIDKGWIPTCGGSYQLSRLKDEVGIYLALTGETINAEQMVELGFMHGILRSGKLSWQYQKQASDIAANLPHELSSDTFDTELTRRQKRILNSLTEMSALQGAEEQIRLATNEKDRDILALKITQAIDKQRKIREANIHNPFTESSWKQNIINYFNYKEVEILNHFEKDLLYPNKGAISKRLPLDKINRIFQYQSVEEILDALQKDGSDWARRTKDIICSKDPLALNLTLKLIRKATNSTFVQCLERQHRVSSRLLSSRNGSIESYFQQNEPQHELEHETKKYALLPTKDYRLALPDTVRFFLNREFMMDFNAQNQEEDVKRWLYNNKVDVNSPIFNVDVLRKNVWLKLEAERKVKVQLQRIYRLLYEDSARKKYAQERNQQLQKTFSPESKIKQLIQKKIKQIFSQSEAEKFRELKTTLSSAALEKKTQLFAKIRDSLVRNTLTEDIQKNTTDPRHKIVPQRAYFPKDGKSIFETIHPDILETPLKLLVQKINKGSLDEPFTIQEMAELDQQMLPELSEHFRQFALENPNFRQYLKRYNGQIPPESKNTRIYLQILETAKTVSETFAALADSLSQQEIVERLKNQKSMTFVQYIQEFRRQIQQLPTADLEETKLSSDEISFLDLQVDGSGFTENGTPRFQVPEQLIPEELRPRYSVLLNSIYSSFLRKFSDNWNNFSKGRHQLHKLDQWMGDSLSADFGEFVKNDVLFLFCYFALKDFEGIIDKLKSLKIDTEEEVGMFLAKYEIKFEDYSKINSTLRNFLKEIVDTYDESRQSLLFPNTKILEKTARLKINNETNNTDPSLEGFLITLGKERNILKQRIHQKPHVLARETEYLLDAADVQIDTSGMSEEDDVGKLLNKGFHSLQYHRKFKMLTAGSFYYIKQIAMIFQKLHSTDAFLPQDLKIDETLAKIPSYFAELDERKTPEQWVADKIDSTIKYLFEIRRKVQNRLTKTELVALDAELEAVLTPENIKQIIKADLENELQRLNFIKKQLEQQKDTNGQAEKRIPLKMRIKNPEALKRVNNFMTAIEIAELKTEDDVFEDYQDVFLRMMTEALSPPKAPKLSESESIRQNFVIKKEQTQAIQGSETSVLTAEIRALCGMHSGDELFSQLEKKLSN